MNNQGERPIEELLRGIPQDHRICIPIQWAEGGMETGHHYIPIGRHAHQAADKILALREQLKDCSAVVDRQQEMLDRNQEKEDSGTTHWAGCSESGPKHYKCALLEIGRLRNTITDLRVKLEAAGTYEDAYESGYQAGMEEKKPWVGLTDEEFHDLQIEHGDDLWANFKTIEAKSKEKNGG